MIQIHCPCGQSFEIDPKVALADNQSMFCPACGADQTELATTAIAAFAPEPAHDFSQRPSAEALANIIRTDRSQVDHEARAKVFWGDQPESVIEYMMGQGVPRQEAASLVAGYVQERLAAIREHGKHRMLRSIPLIATPFALFLISFVIGPLIFKEPGFWGRTINVHAIGVVLGLWGFYLLVDGFLHFISPHREHRAVADL